MVIYHRLRESNDRRTNETISKVAESSTCLTFIIGPLGVDIAASADEAAVSMT